MVERNLGAFYTASPQTSELFYVDHMNGITVRSSCSSGNRGIPGRLINGMGLTKNKRIFPSCAKKIVYIYYISVIKDYTKIFIYYKFLLPHLFPLLPRKGLSQA